MLIIMFGDSHSREYMAVDRAKSKITTQFYTKNDCISFPEKSGGFEVSNEVMTKTVEKQINYVTETQFQTRRENVVCVWFSTETFFK